ncbi:MAG: carboxypeptidase regulatory-like domain-containing protein [Candidatus Acidiferrales bacterium]
MRTALRVSCLLLCLAVFIVPHHASGQLASSAAVLADSSPQAAHASLKICLRQQDDTPFSGLATIRLTSPDGTQVAGRSAESDDQTIFPDLAPGNYVVEAVAPGFTPMTETIEIKARRELETIYLVMRPESFGTVRVDACSALGIATSDADAFHWLPPGVDASVPTNIGDTPCPLPAVLQGVGQRMKQFVDGLQKFRATEQIEHFKVDADGKRESRQARTFDYVVSVSQAHNGVFEIDEFRNGGVDRSQFPAGIATEGLPAMALLFHPTLAADFDFKCEGLGFWEGRPVWRIRFEQRTDRPNRIRDYVVRNVHYAVPIKGRAYIDAGTLQVVRLESELAQPVDKIGLTVERFAINYAPVQFRTNAQELWLPQTAELYVEQKGHRYYREHSFKNFQIFAVDATQKVRAPRESYSFTNTSDQDIFGILTVTPARGTDFRPVSIKFEIPAGKSVFKVVGNGKDVDLPAESVASATFVHNGRSGSVHADAFLMEESTLDLISNSSVSPAP